MFYVNAPTLDYLTVTTYNPVVFGKVRKVLSATARKLDEGKRRMQYTGELMHHEEGTAFLGTGEQKGVQHHLIQVSGLWSDQVYGLVAHDVRTGKAKVTRIDLQLTVEYDRETWSQVDLADALRACHPNRSVSYVESQSGPGGSKLATVYFGSRKSDRYVRIYEKMGLGEDVFLRFEVEYKGPRAMQVMADLDNHGVGEILQGEILRTNSDYVYHAFTLDVTAHVPQVVKPEPSTLKWLREQVAPAFDRVLQDHNIDAGEVADLFRRILDDSPYP